MAHAPPAGVVDCSFCTRLTVSASSTYSVMVRSRSARWLAGAPGSTSASEPVVSHGNGANSRRALPTRRTCTDSHELLHCLDVQLNSTV